MNLFLPGVIFTDSEGHQLVQRQPAVTIDLHEFGADCPEA
jgi:hypothetical protein